MTDLMAAAERARWWEEAANAEHRIAKAVEGERDRLRAENQRLREAIADALADLTPGYAPYSILADAIGEKGDT